MRYSIREMFQRSPDPIVEDNNKTETSKAETSNTSTEFQKLMEPFHSVLQLDDSRHQESDERLFDYASGIFIINNDIKYIA